MPNDGVVRVDVDGKPPVVERIIRSGDGVKVQCCARVTPEQERMIKEAAAADHRSVSSFLLAAAMERIERLKSHEWAGRDARREEA